MENRSWQHRFRHVTKSLLRHILYINHENQCRPSQCNGTWNYVDLICHNHYVHYHRQIPYYFLLHYWHFIFMDTLQRVKDCDKSHMSGLILQGDAQYKVLSELIRNSPTCLTEQGPSQLLQNGSGELWAGELTLQWSWRSSRGNLFICLFWQKSLLVGETAESCLLRVNNHEIPHSCQQLPTFAWSVAVGRASQPRVRLKVTFSPSAEREVNFTLSRLDQAKFSISRICIEYQTNV